MDLDSVAKQLCVSRIAFGAGLILMPRTYARFWTGPGATQRWSRVMARALGARELALGGGGLLALRAGDDAAALPWMAANAATEAADVAFNLTLGPRSPARMAGAAMAAVNAAVFAAWLAERRG
jgi:hypothetical protein